MVVSSYFVIVSCQLEEKVTFIESKPGFHEEMWSMITGIPTEAVNEMHKADDAYQARDYETALEYIQKAISLFEIEKDPNFREYSREEFNKKAGWMFELGAKIANRLQHHELVYQYAKKAVKLSPSSYHFYLLAASAYNLKNYQEAIENVNLALVKDPHQTIREKLIEIKNKALAHLEKE